MSAVKLLIGLASSCVIARMLFPEVSFNTVFGNERKQSVIDVQTSKLLMRFKSALLIVSVSRAVSSFGITVEFKLTSMLPKNAML